MRGLKILLVLIALGFVVTACKTHTRCPAYGGANVETKEYKVPLQSTEVIIEEKKV
jgi:hypothetical protein